MDPRTQKVIALLNENFHHELLFDEMARCMNLSPLSLRRLFKGQTGLTFTHYLRLLRMRKAKELMENTFLTVKEIMSQVGIKDKSHFVKEFKRVYGFPPSKCSSRYSGANIDLTKVVKELPTRRNEEIQNVDVRGVLTKRV
ncbi:MAG: two-component system, response regulator YesN [Blastocatellia bacterium]|jgi:AraC-like DNA-binding protein|nr:two-component system, response regulator YesN [Blastocatellia bacterium]